MSNLKYDPRSIGDRQGLATSLLELFERSMFTEVFIDGTKERLFAREVPGTDGKVRVLVYSTLVETEARQVGKDAIRVCAVYRSRDGQERGIASGEKRVNRTGTINAITDRVIARMRDCWKATKTASKCHCGAPHFKSKVRKAKGGRPASGGNMVCADFCWKSDSEMQRTNAPRSQNQFYGQGYGGRSNRYSARW